MQYDEETQGLVQKNGKNPQDPITAFGKQTSSYSDWSSYEKQKPPKSGSSAK